MTDQTDLERLRELLKVYKDGVALDIELTGRSVVGQFEKIRIK